mmetsp:Transcript_10293/g.24295  ORF Transcript_10293/g.24295 Transcript_10293/m.24295 type:complete len:305 (-) Transcript_10293:93-1007(-)
MAVHLMRPRQQLLEPVHPNAQRNRGPDRAPQRVATPDPVPEPEHVVRCDPKLLNRLGVGGDGEKVLCHSTVFLERFEEPLLCSRSVHHRFLRGEGLGADEEEGRFGVQLLERFRHVRPVDVAHKHHLDLRRVRLQRLRHHHRAQVGPADADVDGVRELLPGEAHTLAGSYLGHELPHLAQHFVDTRHDVLALHHDWCVGTVAKSHVEHRAVLRRVDGDSTEHLRTLLCNASLLRQVHQQLHRLGRDAVFTVVQHDLPSLEAEGVEASWIALEQSAHVHIFDCSVVPLQRRPCRRGTAGICSCHE